MLVELLGAVLITHEHPDHLAANAEREALFSDPELTLWTPEAVAGQSRLEEDPRLEPQELEVVAEVGTGLTCRRHGPSNR